MVRRGSIDAELVQLNPAISNYARLATDKGLLVSKVGQGSNAEKAGLKGGADAVRYGSGNSSSVIYLGGDVITSIAGVKVESLTDYYSALESKKAGRGRRDHRTSRQAADLAQAHPRGADELTVRERPLPYARGEFPARARSTALLKGLTKHETL